MGKKSEAKKPAEEVEEGVGEKTFDEVLAEALESPGAERVPLDVREIPLDEIGEGPNVRVDYDEIERLAETMHVQGQLQPCIVRPSPEGATHGRPFELVAGYRRRRAAEFLRDEGIEGWNTLRCEVREVPDEKRIQQVIVENYQRKSLDAMAEAEAMRMLKYSTDPPMTNVEVARELGCDPSQVSHGMKLLVFKDPPALPSATEESSGESASADCEGENPEPGGSMEIEVAESGVLAKTNEEKTALARRVDIAGMIQRGEINRSTAEVIASVDERENQEKLAELVVRNDWGVKKAAAWARSVKEKQVDSGDEADLGPLELLRIDDVVPMQSLRVRSDLSRNEIDRIVLYALLRNSMDREMLEYLEEEHGVPFGQLWDWVAGLGEEDLAEMTRRMAVRYVGAAHRYASLEPSLVDTLGASDEDPSEESRVLAEGLQAGSSGGNSASALDQILGGNS